MFICLNLLRQCHNVPHICDVCSVDEMKCLFQLNIFDLIPITLFQFSAVHYSVILNFKVRERYESILNKG